MRLSFLAPSPQHSPLADGAPPPTLVNWWIQAKPAQVFGFGQTAFYGADNGGSRAGFAKTYDRAATGGSQAAEDPFAIHLDEQVRAHDLLSPRPDGTWSLIGRRAPLQSDLNGLYGDAAEKVDHYHRDMNVFSKDVGIEDDSTSLPAVARLL